MRTLLTHLDVLVYSVYVLLQCDYVDVYVLKVKQTQQMK